MSFREKLKNFFNTEEEYEYVEEVDVEESNVPGLSQRNQQPNVVNLTKIETSTAKVTLYEPRSYHEVQEIADNLLNKRSVVINLHQVDRQQAKRIVDFLSGTVYAIKGDIQKLGLSTFLCTPENVEVTGEISVDTFDEDEF
ncbi:MAG TPA: cell division protein SepF [Pseudogracilibacillus sp.]|nr:cell division protein SepF [Pseudogracilibacillus sp.]